MKYLSRLIWYLVTRLAALTCALGLMTVVFYFSMNAANIYIILKEGMAQRAKTVMLGEDPTRLERYFARSYLERDNVLDSIRQGANPYERYQITGIDHRLNLKWVWCWPWEDTARATIEESVPAIDGKIISTLKASTPKEQWGVPQWQSGRYDVILTRENGRWHIKNMTYAGAYVPVD